MAFDMSGSRARRYTLIWRGAAVGVGVFAAGLWAVQSPLTSPDVGIPPPATTEPAGPGGNAESEAASSAPDRQAIADAAGRFEVVFGRTPKVEGSEPPPVAPTIAALAGWKYLGSIVEPRRRVAIVSVNGKQAVLAEGRQYEGVTVVEVKPDALVVNDGSKNTELSKQEKAGPSVAWVSPTGGGTGIQPMSGITTHNGLAGTATVPGGMTTSSNPANAAAFPGYTPEEQAQLRERGIDPQQAARMRQRLQQQRERGRMSPDGNFPGDDGRIIRTPGKGRQEEPSNDGATDGDAPAS